MKVLAFHFTARQLRSIHRDHRGFIIASSQCCNELTRISPYIIFEHKLADGNEAENTFIRLRIFTIVRLQIAKIFEYRDLCNNYVGKIRKTFPATAKKVAQEAAKISRAINAAKWAATVRNKVAFHFDSEYAARALDEIADDDLLGFVVGPTHGLTAFDFADRILVNSMFAEAGSGDTSKGAQVVMHWTLELEKQITHFHAEILTDLFSNYGLLDKREVSEVRSKYCAERGSVFIPITTTKSKTLSEK